MHPLISGADNPPLTLPAPSIGKGNTAVVIEGLELLEGSNKENKPAKPNLSKSSVEARLALAQSEF